MSMHNEHVTHEQQLPSFLISATKLSEEQKTFLCHAIRDIQGDTVDLDTVIAERVAAAQRRAYEIYPYKCIRDFDHVSLRISKHGAFTRILETGKVTDPGILLDIGCCMGTDLRHLVHSGYNSSRVIGCDLLQAFIDLGYEFYADRDTCPIPFFAGDVFDIDPSPFPLQVDAATGPSLGDVRNLNDLRGRVKYIYAGSLLHLFDQATQEVIARRLVTLLNLTSGSGPAIIFGRHMGRATQGLVFDDGRIRYMDTPASWEELWQRIVGETRRVHVDSILRPDPSRTNGVGPMWWSICIGDRKTTLDRPAFTPEADV